MKPRVLLAHSHLWPNVARLSIAFDAAGFDVDVIAPKPHPVHKMRSRDRSFFYRSTSPRASVKSAIEVLKTTIDCSLRRSNCCASARAARGGRSGEKSRQSILHSKIDRNLAGRAAVIRIS